MYYLMTQLLYDGFESLALNYIVLFLLYSCVFAVQLFLCLRSKKRGVQLIPMFLLLIALIECIGFFLSYIITYEYWMSNEIWMLFPAVYMYGFGPLWIDIALACLTAHIIKKRKAKKQNSITK